MITAIAIAFALFGLAIGLVCQRGLNRDKPTAEELESRSPWIDPMLSRSWTFRWRDGQGESLTSWRD